MKKIAVCTGTRAEYGLLSPLMKKIKADKTFVLQTLVTGTHLLPEFGNTYQEIESDGFTIDKKITIIQQDDSAAGVARAMALALEGFTQSLHELKPDLVVLLGDRFETLSVATAAWLLKIPIAHIQGGETTHSAWDEAFRHSITKMSWLHFTAANEYRKRVIQLGEDPKRVFSVGALGVDQIKNLKLLGRDELERNLQIKLQKINLVVTFHPVTLSGESADAQVAELLKALDKYLKTNKEALLIFTKSNADEGGRLINAKVEEFIKNHAGSSVLFSSLGQLRYLSLLKVVNAVVGNSSSGILEAPYLYTPTVNVGERQEGRIFTKSVVACKSDAKSILTAINKATSAKFKSGIKKMNLPFGNGTAANKIVSVLKKTKKINTRKVFYDL